jgi:beta-galactosidase GanA
MWSTIEPFENHYNWTIIDETLRECFKNQINVILGTPTATPPKVNSF